MPITMDELPALVRQFALYERNVNGRSPKTVDEYSSDLRTFFRFLKHFRGLVPADQPLTEIPVNDVDLELIRSVTTMDLFEFMNYAADTLKNSATTRFRKTVTLRVFFRFLTVHEKVLETNPAEDLPSPRTRKALPHYLSLEQSLELLGSADGRFRERDYCIFTLFLNCGIRLSELVTIDLNDIQYDTQMLRVTGKGNKQRMIYLNDACMAALKQYLAVRPHDHLKDRNALFLSAQHKRISPKTVQYIVKHHLAAIGLGETGYSVHKLRHTAATLMYQYGDVDIRVLKEILGHENLGTTEIYTHLSNKQMEAAAKANPLAGVRPTGSRPPKEAAQGDESAPEDKDEKE